MTRKELLSLCEGVPLDHLSKLDVLSVLLSDLTGIVAEYRTAVYLDNVERAKEIELTIDKVIDRNIRSKFFSFLNKFIVQCPKVIKFLQ